MAKKYKEEGRGKSPGKRTSGELSSFSTFDAIKELIYHDARNTDTQEGLTLFLKSWWSKEYSRPLKDPLLESYTLHELLYEFYDKSERKAVAEEVFELETDKIEEEQEQESISWAEEEERKDRETAEKAEAEQKAKDEKWMLEQLKNEHGEDFGEDINTEFEE